MKKHNAIKVVLALVTLALLGFAIFAPAKNWANIVMIGLALVDMFLWISCLNEKQNTLKIVLVTMLVFAILTWMIPAAIYSGEFIDQGRIQIGLFDLFNYSLTTIQYFVYIPIYILVVGGFYGILHSIPAYRSFLDKTVAIFKGKEIIFISTIMVLLAVATSVCGIQLVLLAFFPFLASIILLMGFDKIVVALTLVGSTMLGVAGTTYGYANVGLLNSVLELDFSSNLVVKFVILVAGLVLLIYNTIVYNSKRKTVANNVLAASKTVVKTEDTKAESKDKVEEISKPAKTVKSKKTASTKSEVKKTSGTKTRATKSTASKTKTGTKNKKSTAKSTGTKKTSAKSSRKDIKAATKGDDVIVVKESLIDDSIEEFVPTVVNSKHSVWPIALTLFLLFVLVILAFTPWDAVFNLDIFANASDKVKNFELFNFPIFAKLLGDFSSFGEWSVIELSLVLFVISLLLVVIYGIKISDAVDGFVKGLKKAVVPATIVFIIYTILVLVVYNPFQLTVYKSILGLTKGFNIVTTSIVAILAGLFNGDVVYAFQSVLPYFISVVTDTKLYPVVGIIFQSLYGVSMLILPTSLILTVVLSYLGVSYKEWFKSIWKLLAELLIVLLLVFTLLIFI